ncbi:Ig-like domain-containing protein [Parapedobacter koreensis]|nr:Ig-like domain-containing protein [Parapedobacter koreensis]
MENKLLRGIGTKLLVFVFILLSLLDKTYGQQASLGDNIFKEDFGQATVGSDGNSTLWDGIYFKKEPLPYISSLLFYNPSNPPSAYGWGQDNNWGPRYISNERLVIGSYAIATNSQGYRNPYFYSGRDHTGNEQGLMLLVDANVSTTLYFDREIEGLCAGTKFQFSVWIKDINSEGHAKPSVTFNIYDGDLYNGESSPTGLLATYTSGNQDVIPVNRWKEVKMDFVMPAGVGKIRLQIRNALAQEIGNDLAIDDISFRPMGPPISLVADHTGAVCVGSPATYRAKVLDGSAYPTNYFQLQRRKVIAEGNDPLGADYENVGELKTTTGTEEAVFTLPSVTLDDDNYEYRVIVAGDPSTLTNKNCRVASESSILRVYQHQPTLSFEDNDGQRELCKGQSTVLVANVTNGVDDSQTYFYQWEKSTNQTDWEVIDGQSGATLFTGGLAQTTYYRVTAYANGEGGCPGNGVSDVLTIVVNDNCNFTSEKKVVDANNDGLAQAGEQLTYSITVTNNTNESATIAIVDVIPQHTVYVSNATDGDYSNTENEIVWNDVTIPAGSSMTVSFVVKVVENLTGISQVANTALITGEELETQTPTVVIDTDPEKLFVSRKTTDKQRVTAGDELVYTISVENTGNVDYNGISVVDNIPANTTYKAGSASEGATINGDQLTWTIDVPFGESRQVSFAVVVTADLTGVDQIRNVATVIGVDPEEPEEPEVEVPVHSIDALDDHIGQLNDFNGRVDAINVLTNDVLDGKAATISQVTISVVTPEPNGYLTLDTETGSVDVARGTPVGTYQLKYRITDKGDTDLLDEAIVTVEIVCNDQTWISGTVFNIDNGDSPLANVPVTLIPQGDTGGNVLMRVTQADGRFTFEGMKPGSYLLQVQDANLNAARGLYPAGESSSLFFITIETCVPILHDFPYGASDLPVLGDLVWYDTNGDGVDNEWWDANDNGKVDRTDPGADGSIDYAAWEWMDLNGDGRWDGPENEGELNKGGVGNLASLPNIFVSGPNGYREEVIIGYLGYWRHWPVVNGAPLYGQFEVELVMDDELANNAINIAASGKVKTYDAAGNAIAFAETFNNYNWMQLALNYSQLRHNNHVVQGMLVGDSGFQSADGHRYINKLLTHGVLESMLAARAETSVEITNDTKRTTALSSAAPADLTLDFGLMAVTTDDEVGPTAHDDEGNTNQGEPVVLDVLANDVAGSSALAPATVRLVTPNTGNLVTTLEIASEGTYRVDETGQVQFTPTDSFVGTSTVKYTVKDENGLVSNEATITVTVEGGGTEEVAPTAHDDEGSTNQGEPIVLDVLANDVAGSSPLAPATVRLVEPGTGSLVTTLEIASEGTYRVDENGQVQFTPTDAFVGTSTVKYTVKDENGLVSNEATITVTVEGVAAEIAPTAVDDNATTPYGQAITIAVLGNDQVGSSPIVPGTVRLIDATDNRLGAVSIPGEGRYEVNAQGGVTFVPAEGFIGTSTVRYEVSDENGLVSNAATISVTVDALPFKIPNVFTPNGDGRNDVFQILGIEGFDRMEITVVNRWGNEVYRNTNYRNTWDGQGLNEGTYYYSIIGHVGGRQERYTGWVLIKRQ